MSKDGKERRKSRQEDYFEDSVSTRADFRGSSMLQMTSELVTSFSGQDPTYPAARWMQEVEDNAEIFGWTPLQQLLVARRSLTGTAALWLRAERPFKTWDDLKSAIVKEFPDSVDVKTIHETMCTRKKKDDESCQDYMLIMKELGRRGKMPDYVAIKYIIDGIRDLESNKIMLYGVTTYSELKEKLRIYETVKSKLLIQQRRTEVRIPRRKEERDRCFSCGEINHTSAYCPHKEKGLKCFKCNEFGHIATTCPTQQRRGEATAPEHQRSGASGGGGRLHSTDFGKSRSRYPASENERRQQQSSNMNLKRTMFGRLMTSEEGPTTIQQLIHLMPKRATLTIMADKADYNCQRRHQCQLSNTDDSDSNGEVMQIVNQSGKKDMCKPVKTLTMLCGLSVKALIDTGSEVNIISSKCYETMGRPKAENDNTILSGIGQSSVKSQGKCHLKFNIDEKCFDGVFRIVSSDYVPYSIIIGQEFLKGVTMLMRDGTVNFLSKDEEWIRCMVVEENEYASVVGTMSDPELKKQVHQLIHQYGKPAQKKEAPIQLKIILKDDIPVTHRPRRLSLKEQEIVEEQVSEWLENKIIRVSFSEYSSPVVLVKKKDGTTRVCVDYRAINKKIVKDVNKNI